MHAVKEAGSSGIPAFLSKLWTLVGDPSTDDLICWDPSGRSFHIYEHGRFSKEVLPHYFKHNNVASFIRQLNMYGFRKVMHVEHGGLKTEKDDMEFAHQYFIQGQEQLLEFIKRKVRMTSELPSIKGDEMKLKQDDVSRVLMDVSGMKGKQEGMSNVLETLKRENEALWREVASLRQKHNRQQQMVNQLIQFLVTLVGTKRGLGGMKRNMPLMINDASQLQAAKVPKFSRQLSIDQTSPYAGNTTSSNSYGLQSGTTQPASSLTICDITDIKPLLLPVTSTEPPAETMAEISPEITLDSVGEEASVGEQLAVIDPNDALLESLGLGDLPRNLPGEMEPSGSVESQPGSSQKQSTQTQGTPNKTVATIPESSKLPVTNVLTDHVELMQTDLDALQDLLSSQYNFDSNTIFGMLTPEMSLPSTSDEDKMHALSETISRNTVTTRPESANDSNSVAGNALVEYTPADYVSLFDFDDMATPTMPSAGIMSQAEEDTSLDLDTPAVTPCSTSYLDTDLPVHNNHFLMSTTEEID